MKIKSLLIGSAAAAVMTTGAQAADAIVYADPEPMEYVRICDVYGSGFFYIPGTETCLKIGGYYRFQVDSYSRLNAATGSFDSFDGYTTYARFAPSFDVRSQTEWGTLRGFAQIEFNYGSSPGLFAYNLAGGAFTSPNAYGTTTSVRFAYIDIGDQNFLRIGNAWAPSSTWVGGATGGMVYDGDYWLRNRNQIVYTFNNTGAGFTGFVGVVDSQNNTLARGWDVDVEGGVGFGWGSGSWVRGVVGYDTFNSAWGAQAGVNVAFAPGMSAKLSVIYADTRTANSYRVGSVTVNGVGASLGSHWSVLGSTNLRLSQTIGLTARAQWFSDSPDGYTKRWEAGVGLPWTPVAGLTVRPEVAYTRFQNTENAWTGALRIQRDF